MISRPCKRPGCQGYAVPGTGYCAAHAVHAEAAAAATRAHVDRLRGSAAQRGYDAEWRRRRKAKLVRDGYRCAETGPTGARCLTPASVVDHIVPHRGDPLLFWDESNWQCLCKRHHDQKTATVDGGFRGAAVPMRPLVKTVPQKAAFIL